MDLTTSLNKLFSLHQFGIKLGLESTLDICERIGNPHHYLKCFHIAGSNGKGSTSSFIASILMEMGFKVGLYTSPHFVRFNERIRVNGKEIEDEFIMDFVNELNEYIDRESPTFFEITTAMAFKYFYDVNVDFAVIETGLGGRLDSTNVIDPLASVITSISLEHTEILGDTIEKIAAEKGGIIKKQKLVFVGYVPKEAEIILKRIAEEKGSKISFPEQFILRSPNHLVVDLLNTPFYIYKTPLIGKHQLVNSALAVKAISETLNLFDGISYQKGIMNVTQNSKIEGRYEIVCDKPRVIFDSAHNPEGVETFINEFRHEKNNYHERILIFGAMKDKNIISMFRMNQLEFTKIYVSKADIDRAASFEMMQNAADEVGLSIEILEAPEMLIRSFMTGNKDDCLVVLGSMYLLGQIKSKIL